MKRLMIILLAMVIAGTMTATAFAQYSGTAAANGKSQGPRGIYKDQIVAIRENKDANHAVLAENRTLRAGIHQALAALRAANGKLDKALCDQLRSLNTQVRAIADELRQSRGSIKELIAEAKGLAKNGDTDGAKAKFSEIAQIQAERNAKLVQINGLLKQISALLTPAV